MSGLWWIFLTSVAYGFSQESGHINTLAIGKEKNEVEVDQTTLYSAIPPVKSAPEHRTDYSMLPVLIYSNKVSNLLRMLTSQELGVTKMQVGEALSISNL